MIFIGLFIFWDFLGVFIYNVKIIGDNFYLLYKSGFFNYFIVVGFWNR